ncbi:MAG: DUF2523 domain-containing protein [Comamonadaceae bacterium]|jgi:hypothetical protein|nr:DUF2523 domain-containing protein [Comamonadaceae bacterium]
MPVFVAAIGGMLLNIVGSMVGRIFVALGMVVMTYKGLDSSVTWLQGQAVSSLSGLPGEALSLVGYMRVGEAISIVGSAITTRLILDGVQSDSFKKWVLKV